MNYWIEKKRRLTNWQGTRWIVWCIILVMRREKNKLCTDTDFKWNKLTVINRTFKNATSWKNHNWINQRFFEHLPCTGHCTRLYSECESYALYWFSSMSWSYLETTGSQSSFPREGGSWVHWTLLVYDGSL